MTIATRRELRERLDALARADSPLSLLPAERDLRPRGAPGVCWARPELVCEVAFTEWTREGRLRHPSFQGLREDKPAHEVVREDPLPPS
jgi:bifunctional non-homologous end joining protein LigD